ncbi:putative S-adenosyl-L-methionine-dependent methyltransferase [Helianthus debilis subsp. tardiflorus]
MRNSFTASRSYARCLGGVLENWPKRLDIVPPRIRLISGLTSQYFVDDNLMWQKNLSTYAGVLKLLSSGGYRNVMDMNAGLGGFAASLSKYPVWVMNVVPHDAEYNTLGIIYERGLIGT